MSSLPWRSAIVIGAIVYALQYAFGGGAALEDRTTDPVLSESALEVVADLPLPPGNVAVSKTGRVFFTFHPEASPQIHVAELIGGKPVPYPDEDFQNENTGGMHFQTPLSLRIDRQDRLWVLDYAHYGIGGQPRLVAFDLGKNKIVDYFDFPSSVAGRLSMLNDFQIDPSGRHIFIADTSLFGMHPALIVYDVENRRARRILERHPSVMPMNYRMNAAGRDMSLWGMLTLKIGVDSIALDKEGTWLYYGPLSGDRLYRLPVKDLANGALSDTDIAEHVEVWGRKTLSDGLTMDLDGNVYLSDMEHSAILRLQPDHRLVTLAKDPKLRWPDGFSFGPEGWLYVTCSALHQVILERPSSIRGHGPFQIFRFKPGPQGVPGQ